VVYFLGVDGGGTKTLAIVADKDGIVKGAGWAGNSNHQISRKNTETAIRKATEAALHAAGIEQNMLTRSCFGLAGADTFHDFQILHRILQKLGFENYTICNDGLVALQAAETSFVGMTLICGTATNAIGRDREGNIHQIGGFGYAFGDFGGGHQLSKEIFRLVIRSAEGREAETQLLPLVLKKLGFTHIREMYEYYLRNKNMIPVHLTPLLFKAAVQGDGPAISLIEKQAAELVLSAEALAKKMELSAKPFTLVLAGSVITRSKNDLMYDAFLSKLRHSYLQATVKRLHTEPVIGSALLAIGKKNDQETIKQTLIQSLQSAMKGSDSDE